MMRGRGMNPGSIHMRIARIQEKMEDAAERGDLIAQSNLLRRLCIYASVHMTPDHFETYNAMPGLSEDTRTASEVYDDLCKKEEFLLEILKDHDVFTKGKHQQGDASGLDDEEEESVAAA